MRGKPGPLGAHTFLIYGLYSLRNPPFPYISFRDQDLGRLFYFNCPNFPSVVITGQHDPCPKGPQLALVAIPLCEH